jgi:hypothetical protein
MPSEAWLRHPLSESLIAEFEARAVDACGERGEYNACVSNGTALPLSPAYQPGCSAPNYFVRVASKFFVGKRVFGQTISRVRDR